MKRRGLLVLAAAALAGCAMVPRSVVLSESDIAKGLAREFPRRQRVLEFFDVTLQAPRVRLLPERNRIGLDLDLQAAERLSGRTLHGALALDHALRFEPSDGTVRLAQVHVERLALDEAGAPLPVLVQRLGALLAEHLLDDAVIWRARPELLQRLRAAGVEAAAVDVTSRGVEITLAPR